VMFNEEVDVEYPGDQIFIPSVARWFQLKSIKIKLLLNSIPPDEFKGEFLVLRNSTGEKQQITIYDIQDITVKQSENEPSFVYEIFFQDELFINIDVGDILEGEEFTAEIIPSISKVIVVNPGSKFRFGQVLNFNSITGSGAIGMVSAVTTGGGIRNVKMLRFGKNYESAFYVSITPEGAFTETGFSFETTGDADIARGVQDYTAGYEESMDLFRSDYVLNDGIEGYNPFYVATTYCGQFVSQTRSRQFFFQEDDNSALLLCLVGPISQYPGKYLDRSGMASNSSYLQDNNYYQNFSYVVRSKSDITSYRDIVESFAHPAGMKLFGDKTVENLFELEPRIILTTSTTHTDSFIGMLTARAEVNVRAEAVFPVTNDLTTPDINIGETGMSAYLHVANNMDTSVIDFNTAVTFAQGTLSVR
jgi:hypothetical protein